MKTAEQWAREWKWDCLPPEEKQAIRAIQADALRHAAELARREGCDLQAAKAIEAEAAKLEGK